MAEQKEQLHKIRITHTVFKITFRIFFFPFFNEYKAFENNFWEKEKKKEDKVYLRPP